MIYLKRLLWLAAWSVWVWLGFGLYRELPRDLGPVVCRLEAGEEFRGFFRGSPSILTTQLDVATSSTVFRRRNALTGEIEREYFTEAPISNRWIFGAFTWLELVVGYENASSLHLKDPGEAHRIIENLTNEVRMLDLRTGKWTRHENLGPCVGHHANKRWLIFQGTIDRGAKERVVVLDVDANRRIFEIVSTPGAILKSRRPMFIGNCIVIPVPDGQGDFRYEVRSIPHGEFIASFLSNSHFLNPSCDGKVVIESWTPQYALEIRDVLQGTTVFKSDLTEPRSLQRRFWYTSFSSDGRRFLWPSMGELFDLDSDRTIWKAKSYEYPSCIFFPDLFQVAEVWLPGFDWGESHPTYAVRSARDGSFVCRRWSQFTTFNMNNDASLMVVDGVIHRWPPPVNWWLLAFCQSVLALPLVLLWAALLLRRRRAARRQPIEPS